MPPISADVRIALVGCGGLALAIGVGRFAFTPVLPMMLADGLIDIRAGGWLAAAHFMGYLAGALTAAAAPFAPRPMLRASLFAIAVGAFAMGVTESFPAWLALRFVMGVVSAWTLTLVGNYAVKHLAARSRAGLQGWVFAGVGAGIALAGFACLGFMAGGVGGADAWRILGAAAFLAACVLSFGAGEELPDTRPERRTRAVARSPLDWPAVVAYGAMGFGYIVPATYLPVMAEARVPDPLVFGWVWPAFGAAACLSTVLAARLWARYANRKIWIVGQVIMALGVILPALHPHILTVIAAGLAVGGTFMIVTMAGVKAAHLTAAPADVMRHIGVMTAAFALGQMVGPLLAALAYDATGDFAAPLAAASAALLGTAAALARRPRPVG